MARSVKLNNRLPEIQANLRLAATQSVREGANLIAARAKQRAPDAPPIGEGLVDAIHVEKPANTTYTYAVVAGNDEVFWGHMQEFGTVKHAPQPFLIPAVEESKDEVTALVAKALGRL